MKKTQSVKRLIRAEAPSERNSLASARRSNETLELLHSNLQSMRQLDDLSGSACIDYQYEQTVPDILVISQSDPPPTESAASCTNFDLMRINETTPPGIEITVNQESRFEHLRFAVVELYLNVKVRTAAEVLSFFNISSCKILTKPFWRGREMNLRESHLS